MGKSLIIKDADFSENSISTFQDITDICINGFVSGTNTIKLYNSQYNNTNTLIPNFLILMTNASTFYATNNKIVEWFLPIGLHARCFAMKTNYTINSSTGVISNCVIDTYTGGGTYPLVGNNNWVTKSSIYSILNVSESYYPIYGIFVARYQTSGALSLQQAKVLGFRVRLKV